MTLYRQLTIRELMLLVTFAAVGIAGLSTGGLLASLVIGAAFILTTALAIVAFVGRDQFRAFAIGFLIPVVAYSTSVLSIGKSELDAYEGKLPTTKLIQSAFEFLVKREYVNAFTGEPVPDYDPSTNSGGGGGGFAANFANIGARETPDRTTFMSLAHVLFAMICGYVGAKFAVWIHHRQFPRSQTGDEQ